MLMRRVQPVLALCGALCLVAVALAATSASGARRPENRSPEAGQGRHVAPQPAATAEVRASQRPTSATVKALVVGGAVLVGVVVGLTPVALLGIDIGLVPNPRRRRARAAPPRAPSHAQAIRPAAPGSAIPPARAIAIDASAEPPAPVPSLGDGSHGTARNRHRELYDAEYAEQVRRIETLRRTVSTRLPVPPSPDR